MFPGKIELFLAALFPLVAAAGVSEKDSYAREGYRLLSGEEVRSLHRNMRHELKLDNGTTGVAFYKDNGNTLFIRSDGLSLVGVWEIRGDYICYVYKRAPATKDNCHSLAEKNGHYVFFREFDGPLRGLSAEVLRITPDKMENLPLD